MGRYIAGTCVLLEHGHKLQVGSLAYRNDWLAGYMISPTERGREKREKLAAVRAEEVPKYYYCDYYLTSCYGVVWIHTTYRSKEHGPRPRHVGSQRTAATA